MIKHSLSLYPATQASRLKRLTLNLPFSTIRIHKHEGKNDESGGGEGHGIDKERAPTTAEEFKRVAEEKSRRGLSSQTAEKARDGAEEATVGSSQPQPVKEAYKGGGDDFHKKGGGGDRG